MEEDLIRLGSMALKKAAMSEDAKAYVLNNTELYNLLKKAADRYIAGESREEALDTILLFLSLIHI